jgi:hypothetical protein
MTDDLSPQSHLEHYEKTYRQQSALDTTTHGQLETQSTFVVNLHCQKQRRQQDTLSRLHEVLMECSTDSTKHRLEFSLQDFRQNQLARLLENSAQIVPAQLLQKQISQRWTQRSQQKLHSHSAAELNKTAQPGLRKTSQL